MRARAGAALLAGALLISGCGSSAQSNACGRSVRAAVAHAVGARSARAEIGSRAPNKVTCLYEATAPGGGKPEAMSVTVDSGPRAYTGFTTQLAHLVQFQVAGQIPSEVSGVGGDADWLQGPRELLAATAKRFVTVTVLGHGTGGAADLAAAKEVARAALR